MSDLETRSDLIDDFWLNDARRREAGNAFSTLRKKLLSCKHRKYERQPMIFVGWQGSVDATLLLPSKRAS